MCFAKPDPGFLKVTEVPGVPPILGQHPQILFSFSTGCNFSILYEGSPIYLPEEAFETRCMSKGDKDEYMFTCI